MTQFRQYLPPGTLVEISQGQIYRIAGEPLGSGGGSVIYPAKDALREDGLDYALKECYPLSLEHAFFRREDGQILPLRPDPEAEQYLRRVQENQLKEAQVTRKIFQTASRMLPIRASASQVMLTLPGQAPALVSNTVTVMDSMEEKGRSLDSWIREKGRFTPLAALRILQQLLLSLREIHQAGYLHLDIQGGNVFLRGTLEERSELVTLIDFGAARPLREGKTEPIADRVIFTTQGFCAPEILTQNDGTLRLGPEADLYSVGCLALYLLTGQRPNPAALMANRSGLYLAPNQLRRLKCPRHLVDRLQNILSQALARDPQARYQSAGAMLAQVTELMEALLPARSSLHQVDYDAFVCYKHGPIDSPAAKHLQQRLENYRAPRGIGQKRRPFSRVFVDEGELSSCADFGEQIHAALKNSQWLIVVCSPDTPDSPWVRQEIDTFLQYHDRSRILAVLTGGEPGTAFPPQLLGDGDGKGEVLAADARGSTLAQVQRKLSGDALLRLAAPMLGTTFDGLKQRRKVQLFQRAAGAAAAAFALVSAFALYALRQNQRIQEQYRSSQLNESKYLANLARERLTSADTLGAIEAALRALPATESDPRPVLPEAQLVLEEVLSLYSIDAAGQQTAVQSYSHNSAVQNNFLLDPERELMLSCDESYLYLWDTSTGKELWKTHVESDLIFRWELFAPEEGRFFYYSGGQLHCLDYLTQETVWTYSLPEKLQVQRLCWMKTSRMLAILVKDTSSQPQQLCAIQLLDPEGKLQKEHPLHWELGNYDCSEGMMKATPTEEQLIFNVAIDDPDSGTTFFKEELVIFSLNTGSLQATALNTEQLSNLLFIDEHTILIGTGGNASVSIDALGLALFSQKTATFALIDTNTAEVRWRTDQPFSGFHPTVYLQQNPWDPSIAWVSYANHFAILNMENGDVLNHWELSDTVLGFLPGGPETFMIYTRDGHISYCGSALEAWITASTFMDNVIHLRLRDDNYYILYENSQEIIQYAPSTGDPSWTPVLTDLSEYTTPLFYDNWIVLYSTTSENLTVYNQETGQRQSLSLISGDSGCSLSFQDPLAIQEENGTPILMIPGRDFCGSDRHSSYFALYIDLQTLEQTIRYLPVPTQARTYYPITGNSQGRLTFADAPVTQDCLPEGSAIIYQDQQAFFLCLDHYFSGPNQLTEALRVYTWEPGSSQMDLRMEISDTIAASTSESIYPWPYEIIPSPNSRYLLNVDYHFSEDQESSLSLSCIDIANGKLTPVLSETVTAINSFFGDDSHIAWSPDSRQFALVLDQAIQVYDTKGTATSIIAYPDAIENIASISFLPAGDQLLVADLYGGLCQYDLKTGEVSHKAELGINSDFSFLFPDWTFLEDTHLILRFIGGIVALDLREETWGVCSSINSSFISYDPATDRYYIWRSDEDGSFSLGYYQRYPVAEMVEMGRELLGQ